MPRTPIVSVFALAIAAFASAGWSQGKPAADHPAKGAWAPPGTPGSPIDGKIFHAQVLLDAAGFPPGGLTARRACRSRRRSRASRKRRARRQRRTRRPTRQALLAENRPSTSWSSSTARCLGPVRLSLPEEAGGSGQADLPRLSQHAREAGRAISHDAGDDRRAERAGRADRRRADAATAQRRAGVARLFGVKDE